MKIQALLIAATLTVVGCGTLPDSYAPRTLGHVKQGFAHNGVKASIQPAQQPYASIGDRIAFDVTLQNISEYPVLIPREPGIKFLWIYPTGRRDNFVREFPDRRYFRPNELVTLDPAETLTFRQKIDTYYFPRNGFTEFQAMIVVPENSNPALPDTWHGKLLSNAYGMMFFPPERLSYYRE